MHAKHDHSRALGIELPHSKRVLGWTLLLATSFMLVEALGGWLAHSLALLADAGHMLTDVLSLALAFFALHGSTRAADARRTYGYRRYQVLAAFVNGLLQLLIGAAILVGAATRLLAPPEVSAPTMLVVGAVGLGINALMYALLHREHNLNARAALAHVVGDLLGSAAAVVAALIILASGWMAADAALSALVALWLFASGISLVRESGHVLLEGSPEHLDLSDLGNQLCAAVPGLIEVHHVHTWSLTPEQPIMTLHAIVQEHADGDRVIAEIGRFLRVRHGIAHVTVQIERVGCDARCA